jgi:hypothetical protein
LQDLNGCEEPLDRVVAHYGEFEYRRCPVQSIDTNALRVYTLHAEGYLSGLNSHQRKLLPSQLYEALKYIEQIARPPKE